MQDSTIRSHLAAMAFEESPENSPEQLAAWTNWAIADMQARKLNITQAIEYVKGKFQLEVARTTLTRAIEDKQLPARLGKLTPFSKEMWLLTEYDLVLWMVDRLLEVDPGQFKKGYTFDDMVKAKQALQKEEKRS